jgi:hypothetical protein
MLQEALPLDGSSSGDLTVKASVNHSVELLIRSHALLVGNEWAVLMHVEAAQGGLVAAIERSRDLRWLNRQQHQTALAEAREMVAPALSKGRASCLDCVVAGGTHDASLIAEALADGVALCTRCISRKTGVPVGEVEPVIARIGETVCLHTGVQLCDSCLTARKVYRLV